MESIDVGKAMVAKSVPDLVPVVVLAFVWVVMVGDIQVPTREIGRAHV